jgi:hypothetical protein
MSEMSSWQGRHQGVSNAVSHNNFAQSNRICTSTCPPARLPEGFVIRQQAWGATIQSVTAVGVCRNISGTILGSLGPSHATVASANRSSRAAEG